MAEKNAKQVESIEHIPAGEHGRGFPPFEKQTFASQLLWFTLTFVVLYLLMSRVALPRIGSILEERRRHIADDLAQGGQAHFTSRIAEPRPAAARPHDAPDTST